MGRKAVLGAPPTAPRQHQPTRHLGCDPPPLERAVLEHRREEGPRPLVPYNNTSRPSNPSWAGCAGAQARRGGEGDLEHDLCVMKDTDRREEKRDRREDKRDRREGGGGERGTSSMTQTTTMV